MNIKLLTTYSIIFFVFVLFSAHAVTANAVDTEAGAAGALVTFEKNPEDLRVAHLKSFFHTYKSPFENEANAFVEAADRNNLDWRLVAAIAGTESTFGKQIPAGSYNAWGWGIPTGAQSGIAFNNWKHGIDTVSDGLNKNYLLKGAAGLNEIGAIYAASPAWASHVQYFIDKIAHFIPTDKNSLAVSL